MPVPFGFGVGDFIAVIGLITKVRKALKDSGGASSEFQDVVQELGSLQRILTHLGTIHFKERAGTSPALNLTHLIATCQRPLTDFLDHIARFQSSLNASTPRNIIHTSPRKAQWGIFMGAEIAKLRSVVAAKILQLQLVLQSSSMESLVCAEAKTAKIHSFVIAADSNTQVQLAKVQNTSNAIQTSLERNSQAQADSTEALERTIERNTEKVKSQLNMLERCQNHYFPTLISFVKSINRIVTTSNNRIQDVQDCQRVYFPRILSAIQVTLVKIDDLAVLGTQLLVASRAWPEEIRGLLKMLCETNAKVYSAILALQRQRGLLGFIPFSTQDNIHFEDALGRHRNLPYEYFRNWEIFEAMLKSDFKNCPGEENINQGRFHLLNNSNQQQILRKRDWEHRIFPGTVIVMSMILSLISALGETCPRHGCKTRGNRISQESRFFKCPKCNLLFEPEYVETYKADPLPEVQVENNNSRVSLSGPAPDFEISQPRSSPRVHKFEDLPRASKTHERRGLAQSQNDQHRQNTRKKEISDLTYFRRVHLLPAEKNRVKKGHWIRKALTQERSATPFQTLRSSVCYGRDEDDIEYAERLEEYDNAAKLSLDRNFTIKVMIRPWDLRAKLLCRSRSSYEDSSEQISCVHVTRLLLERKNVSTIELYGPSSVQLWAVLSFRNFEGLVLFFCCFQALKVEDLGERVGLIASDHLEGEERFFSRTIIDDGYEHVLRIYKDVETGVVRLQASVPSGEMQNTPVWTAFITHVLHSTLWKRRSARTVYLADIEHIVFNSKYKPSAHMTFTTANDAIRFMDAIDNLAGV